MASPRVGPSTSKTPNVKDLQAALYTKCRSHFLPDQVFFQQDLVDLKVIPNNNLELLWKCAQALVNTNLFKVHLVDGRTAWKTVKEDEAAKYNTLTPDEKLIYAVIDSSKTTGIWTKLIKSRTGLHQSVVSRCLKSLETKSFVKTVRNVKHPSQKIYMVYGLQPNEDVTGGAWFTDGSLDEGFIQGLGEFVVKHVASKSWAESSGPSSSDSIALTAVKTGDKRKLSGIGEEGKGKGKAEGGAKRHQQSKTKATTVYLPYPPGYTGYPTLQDITTAINSSKVFDVEMGPETTQQLLDVLCFDGRLVKVRNGQAYKSVRKPGNLKLDIKDSSLTEAPCGRCPVFELCEEGGPINAGNCEYFQEWLEIF